MKPQRRELPIVSLDAPSRQSRVETYLYDKCDDISIRIANDFLLPDKPIHSSGVLIPVAAHQEAGRIAHSMSEYATQEGADPFTIFLLLNVPSGADDVATAACISEVENAKFRHPNLDIRYSILEYKVPVIGEIRKDLWDGAVCAALRDGIYDTPDGEFIGVNHDIDTDDIGRHYMRNIQHHYQKKQHQLSHAGLPEDLLQPQLTQVKHSYPFDTHPNIARAILWTDFKCRRASPNGSYEEGLVIPFTQYAHRKGFDREAKTYETKALLPASYAPRQRGIAGTPMNTSPRRYIERFAKHGYEKLWTDDSFTATDACRRELLSPDITHDELESHIFLTLENDLESMCARIPMSQIQTLMFRRVDTLLGFSGRTTIGSDELQLKMESLVRPHMRLAHAVLQRAIRSETLAAIANDETTIAGLARKYTDNIESEAKKAFNEL